MSVNDLPSFWLKSLDASSTTWRKVVTVGRWPAWHHSSVPSWAGPSRRQRRQRPDWACVWTSRSFDWEERGVSERARDSRGPLRVLDRRVNISTTRLSSGPWNTLALQEMNSAPCNWKGERGASKVQLLRTWRPLIIPLPIAKHDAMAGVPIRHP